MTPFSSAETRSDVPSIHPKFIVGLSFLISSTSFLADIRPRTTVGIELDTDGGRPHDILGVAESDVRVFLPFGDHFANFGLLVDLVRSQRRLVGDAERQGLRRIMVVNTSEAINLAEAERRTEPVSQRRSDRTTTTTFMAREPAFSANVLVRRAALLSTTASTQSSLRSK